MISWEDKACQECGRTLRGTHEEAARAHDRFMIEKWGEFARPNFPSEAEGAA